MSTAVETLRALLGLGSLEEIRPGELVAEVGPSELRAVALRASAAGMRLGTLFGSDEGQGGRFAVHQVWVAVDPPALVRVVVRVEGSEPRFPSIAATHPAANWFEREVCRLLRACSRGPPQPIPGGPSRGLAGWCLGTPQGLLGGSAGATEPREPASLPTGHRRGCLPCSRGPRSCGHHRARPLPVRSRRRARAIPPAPALLRPQRDREAIRDGCRGAMGFSSRSPSRAIRASATPSPSPTPSNE